MQALQSTPFLTDLDSRAAIKGSRDPLGLVPIWTRFGRHVVGNLSTVSNSTRGFTTLLLGYYLAEVMRDREGSSSPSTLDVFLKFEQLAGYVRVHLNKDEDLRGIERVKKALANGPVVTVSAATDHQILSNQRVYGLWGLFSVPARTSGLLERDELALTVDVRQFVERKFVAALNANGLRGEHVLVELLRRKQARVELDGKHAAISRSLAKVLGSRYAEDEQRFYRYHLVEGGPADSTRGRQAQLARLLESTPRGSIEFAQVRGMIKEASRKGSEWSELVHRLQDIADIEQLLVPAAEAFGFLLTRHGRPIRAVAQEIAKTWGRALSYIDQSAITALEPELSEAFRSPEPAARLVNVAAALATGSYEEVLRLLLEHNAFLMQNRNGSAPWVRLEDGRLDVRFRDETRALTPGPRLPRVWHNPYFIDSVKTILRQIGNR